MKDQVSIRIGNSIAEVSSALDESMSWLGQFEVSAKAQYFVRLAIEELATNWIKYGCSETKEHLMTFDLRHTAERMILKVTDNGALFNPLDAPIPSTDLPLEERELGGIGILLLRKMADQMSYEHRDGMNILTLEKASQ
jgi:anti-sigma regulatory factor (Ser/Thr protein kinase)